MTTIYRPNLPQGTLRGDANEFRQIAETSRRLKEAVEALRADVQQLTARVEALENNAP